MSLISCFRHERTPRRRAKPRLGAVAFMTSQHLVLRAQSADLVSGSTMSLDRVGRYPWIGGAHLAWESPARPRERCCIAPSDALRVEVDPVAEDDNVKLWQYLANHVADDRHRGRIVVSVGPNR